MICVLTRLREAVASNIATYNCSFAVDKRKALSDAKGGYLVVEVIEAQELFGMEKYRDQDPFVQLKVTSFH